MILVVFLIFVVVFLSICVFMFYDFPIVFNAFFAECRFLVLFLLFEFCCCFCDIFCCVCCCFVVVFCFDVFFVICYCFCCCIICCMFLCCCSPPARFYVFSYLFPPYFFVIFYTNLALGLDSTCVQVVTA